MHLYIIYINIVHHKITAINIPAEPQPRNKQLYLFVHRDTTITNLLIMLTSNVISNLITVAITLADWSHCQMSLVSKVESVKLWSVNCRKPKKHVYL